MNFNEFKKKYSEPVIKLYRGFDKKEHLEDFVNGNIRLGH